VDDRAHPVRALRKHVGWVDAASGEPGARARREGALRRGPPRGRGHSHRRPQGAERLRPAQAHRVGRRGAGAGLRVPRARQARGARPSWPRRATARGWSSTRRRTGGSSFGRRAAWSRSPAPRGSTATSRGRSPGLGPGALRHPQGPRRAGRPHHALQPRRHGGSLPLRGPRARGALRVPPPPDVGSTQGAGIGGMQKLRRLYLDHPLDRPRQGDALQETLINVTAAWVVQTLVGQLRPHGAPRRRLRHGGGERRRGRGQGARRQGRLHRRGRLRRLRRGGRPRLRRHGRHLRHRRHARPRHPARARCRAPTTVADAASSRRRAAAPCSSPRRPRRAHGPAHLRGGGPRALLRRRHPPQHPRAGPRRDGRGRRAPAPRRRGQRRGALRPHRAKHRVGARASGSSTRSPTRSAPTASQRSRPASGAGSSTTSPSGDERVSPLRRALAVFGLVPDDVAAAWKHDTSTDANDPNENRAYDRIFRWLGRAAGNPLVVVSQKALTGHSKGGAAAWQVAGLCQALATGIVPGNPNLDDPDPVMRAYETVPSPTRPCASRRAPSRRASSPRSASATWAAIVCLVHPDRALAALDDAAFETYAARRATPASAAPPRRARRLRRDAAPPCASARTRRFLVPADAAYAGLDAEQAVLLDASSRSLTTRGPIVAGGVAERIAAARRPSSPRRRGLRPDDDRWRRHRRGRLRALRSAPPRAGQRLRRAHLHGRRAAPPPYARRSATRARTSPRATPPRRPREGALAGPGAGPLPAALADLSRDRGASATTTGGRP
jgi:hypothetical protein